MNKHHAKRWKKGEGISAGVFTTPIIVAIFVCTLGNKLFHESTGGEYESTGVIALAIIAVVVIIFIVFLIVNRIVLIIKNPHKYMIFSKLNLDYIIAFLQKKAIVTNKLDEQNLVFKLSDVNWRLFYDGHRLSISAVWGIDDDTNLTLVELATNAINSERYIVKGFITKNEEDESQTSAPYSIWFTIETLCHTKKAFKQIYEFAMFALIDGVQQHQKLYAQYIEDAARQRQQIDFDSNKTSNMPTA